MFIKPGITFWMMLLLLAASGCRKEDDPRLSPVPQIEFVSVSSTSIREFSDSLLITIRYSDGDGDLGMNQAGARNVFVKDSRNKLVYEFRLQELAPEGSEIAITGEMDIRMENIPLISEDEEQVFYKIHLTDRAGNYSNQVATPLITVSR